MESACEKHNPEQNETIDVLIVGGGTSGIIAAIQSARLGAMTTVIEFDGQLGGTITTGGVSYPGLFHAHGRQIIKGIGWELIKETVQMNYDKLPGFKKSYGKAHSKHHILINPYLFALLAEEKCLEAGVNLRFYETPINAKFDGKYWIVEIAGKGTHETIKCKQLIDCTGNAILTQIAGFGVKRSEECQPGTMKYSLKGIRLKTPTKILIQNALRKEKSLDKTWQALGKGFNHVYGADSTTSKTHTKSNIKGRTMLLKMIRILQSTPKLGNITLESMCSEVSVRETYRIDGLHEITYDEYINGKMYEDSLCYTFYPIDLHNKEGVKPKHLEKGIVPTIPLRALIPKNSSNFMIAGRCISSDQLANSALRVQPSCMAMGQIAGLVAALASQRNETPINIPITEIQKKLKEYGAIVPTFTLN